MHERKENVIRIIGLQKRKEKIKDQPSHISFCSRIAHTKIPFSVWTECFVKLIGKLMATKHEK